MEDDLLAPNSDSERDSDLFSDELFDEPSECGGSFCAQFNARAVDYEGSTCRGEPLQNATATEPARLSPERNTQELILDELKKVNSRLESFSDRLDALDCRLKTVEEMQLSCSTPSSSISTDDGSAGKPGERFLQK